MSNNDAEPLNVVGANRLLSCLHKFRKLMFIGKAMGSADQMLEPLNYKPVLSPEHAKNFAIQFSKVRFKIFVISIDGALCCLCQIVKG